MLRAKVDAYVFPAKFQGNNSHYVLYSINNGKRFESFQ